MARLSTGKYEYKILLTGATIQLLKEDAERMACYQADIIQEATRLYSNLFSVWEDERKHEMSFEEFIEDQLF